MRRRGRRPRQRYGRPGVPDLRCRRRTAPPAPRPGPDPADHCRWHCGRQSLAHAETASLRPQAVTHCSRASDRRRHGDLDCRHHDGLGGGSGDEPTATRRLTGGRLSSSSGPRLRNLRLVAPQAAVPRHAAGGRVMSHGGPRSGHSLTEPGPVRVGCSGSPRQLSRRRQT